MSCKEAMAAVVAVVQTGGPIPDEQREHLKNCVRCRDLLESAEEFQSTMADPPLREPHVDDRRLTHEVRAMRLRDVLRRAATAAVIALVISIGLGVLVWKEGDTAARELAIVTAVIVLLSVIPVLIFYGLLAALRDRHGNRTCKRLKPGRQLSGVCLGLSEATGISVVVFRLAFLALLFVKGAGLWLYIVLDLAMPVHPGDRQYLLRFKLRRALQRGGHATNDAG